MVSNILLREKRWGGEMKDRGHRRIMEGSLSNSGIHIRMMMPTAV